MFDNQKAGVFAVQQCDCLTITITIQILVRTNICMMLLLILKYVTYVGDSKRAIDEYTSEIFKGGQSTIVLHNTYEDSLLDAPIVLG